MKYVDARTDIASYCALILCSLCKEHTKTKFHLILVVVFHNIINAIPPQLDVMDLSSSTFSTLHVIIMLSCIFCTSDVMALLL